MVNLATRGCIQTMRINNRWTLSIVHEKPSYSQPFPLKQRGINNLRSLSRKGETFLVTRDSTQTRGN